MISLPDLQKLHVLMQRGTLQCSEAEDYVALKYRVESAIQNALNPPPTMLTPPPAPPAAPARRRRSKKPPITAPE